MSRYGITVLRVVLGAIFVMHAYLALVVYTPAGIIAFNAAYGIPFPAVAGWFLILGHGIGGLFMILGLWTRWAALANLVVSRRASSSTACSWTARPRRRATSTC
jgi:putative oxidoreductase